METPLHRSIKLEMRRSRFLRDRHFLWRWAGWAVTVQLCIIAIICLEGYYYHAPSGSEPASDINPPISRPSSFTPQQQNPDEKDKQSKDWLEELLQIPIDAIVHVKDDGNPLGFEANYTIAVKVFRAERKIDEDVVNEMKLHSVSHNPGIVRFLGTILNDTERTVPPKPAGFMMEYYPGQQLEHILDELSKRSLPPLPRAARYKIALDIARALEYLHSINIIHFDVKPEQLMVTGFPPSSRSPVSAKLIDFGMALRQEGSRYVDAILEGGDRWRGTRHYLAPEQVLNDRNVTEMVDVWSFGVVLWEMYTREYPYKRWKMSEVMDRMRDYDPVGLRLPSAGEPEWNSLVRDCLQWHPEDRPSFKEIAVRLSEDLRSILLEETGGKNNSNSVWVDGNNFDKVDHNDTRETDYEMVGMYKNSGKGRDLLGERFGSSGMDAGCFGAPSISKDLVDSALMSNYPINLGDLDAGEHIGHGSYGDVFLSNWTVRAKIYEKMDAHAMHEVRVLSTLHHPNIIRLIGATVNGSVEFDVRMVPVVSGIITEHLGLGTTTLKDIGKKMKLKSEDIGEIGAQLASALVHIHSHHIALLGLTPKNIVMHFNSDGYLAAKITDVSLSQCLKTPAARPGLHSALKTRDATYIAPEVLSGESIGMEADIYSLGKIMGLLCQGPTAPSPAKIGCSREWRALARECQQSDPKLRPDAESVLNRIAQLGGRSSVTKPQT
ncbi:hypothetical protein BSKO_07128 [Bryopsis sp. KO-2023]|nr:hypothetical protein BSKO_07128 [Bryopsis sp. KO-2023]